VRAARTRSEGGETEITHDDNGRRRSLFNYILSTTNRMQPETERLCTLGRPRLLSSDRRHFDLNRTRRYTDYTHAGSRRYILVWFFWIKISICACLLLIDDRDGDDTQRLANASLRCSRSKHISVLKFLHIFQMGKCFYILNNTNF